MTYNEYGAFDVFIFIKEYNITSQAPPIIFTLYHSTKKNKRIFTFSWYYLTIYETNYLWAVDSVDNFHFSGDSVI